MQSFQQEPCWEMDVEPKVSFAHSSNNKDQLRDLHNLSLKSLWRRTSIWLDLFDLVYWQFEVQMKSKHTSMAIVHIKFLLKRKAFVGIRENRIYIYIYIYLYIYIHIYIWADLLLENKIIKLCTKDMLRLCLCKQTHICMSV